MRFSQLLPHFNPLRSKYSLLRRIHKQAVTCCNSNNSYRVIVMTLWMKLSVHHLGKYLYERQEQVTFLPYRSV